MAVACAGLQSVFTAAYDEAFAIPTELAARTALRVQQIVAYETDVAKTVDPLAGSYFVEALTDDMEQRDHRDHGRDRGAAAAWCAAWRTGYVQQRIAERAYEYQRELDSGRVPVVGVNVSKAREEEPMQIHRVDEAAERAKAEAVAEAARDARQRARRRGAGRARGRRARRRDNLMPPIYEAVRPTRPSARSPTACDESSAPTCRRRCFDGGRIRVLVGNPGLDGTIAAQGHRLGAARRGHGGHLHRPARHARVIVATAIQESVD